MTQPWMRALPLLLGAWLVFLATQILLVPSPWIGGDGVPMEPPTQPFHWLPHPTSLTDILLNFLAFLALGLLWGTVGLRRPPARGRPDLSSPRSQVEREGEGDSDEETVGEAPAPADIEPLQSQAVWLLTGWLVGTLLAVGGEYLQQNIPGRTPSGLDILTDSVGTALGLLLACRVSPSLLRWGTRWIEPPAGIGLPVAGLMLLIPLEVLFPPALRTSPSELREGLRLAVCWPPSGSLDGWIELAGRSRLSLLGVFGLGWLLRRRFSGRPARGAVLGISYCVGLELIQLGLVHHVCDIRQGLLLLLCWGGGWLLGAGTGFAARRLSRGTPTSRPGNPTGPSP